MTDDSWRPRIYAHRGSSATHPENTLSAFRAGLAKGADGIEFDVHLSEDDHPVVHHDYDLSRTTTGHGLVHEQKLSYLRSLSAGAWFGGNFIDEQIPLLQEVLALPCASFELELKGLPTHRLLDAVISAARNQGALERITFTSFHLVLLCALRARLPDAHLALFSRPRMPRMSTHLYGQVLTETAALAGIKVVQLWPDHLTSPLIDHLRDRGLTVQAAAVNTEFDIQRALDIEVDQLTTDDPALAVSIMLDRLWAREPATL